MEWEAYNLLVNILKVAFKKQIDWDKLDEWFQMKIKRFI